MNKRTVWMMVIAFAAGIAAYANRPEVFAKMDKDQDGLATREEFFAFWKDLFVQADKNGDGFHDNKEHAGASFKHFDADEDGKISPEEDLAKRNVHFGKLDVNGDGSLTQDEFLKKAKTQQ